MRAIIVLNGDLPAKVEQRLLPEDFIIATDGGARHLKQLGVHPNAVVGDMDSISADDKHKYADKLIVHDSEDFNDAEKALHLAIKMGFDQILFLAFEGSRLDHLLATVMLLREYQDKDIILLSEEFEATVINKEHTVEAKKGARVSLVPLNNVAGITTIGLKYPLTDEALRSSTHGVSNVAVADEITIKVKKGALLLMRWFEEKG